MPYFRKTYFNEIYLILFISILICFGCASIQSPTGGPRDKTPPKILREAPKNQTRNFNAKQINIQFDEFVKLSNEFKEISISPEMEKLPIFKVVKKVLEIKFQDTLMKNTTYTINFGKAIVDYNEGNILKNYSYVFSTGNTIDSLSISGNVINSITKTPEMETTVFIVPVKQDTIFGKRKASIFTTTDSSGNFALHNLRANQYKIYAVKETGGGDRIYNSPNEDVAFLKDTINLKGNISNIKLQTFKQPASVFRTVERKLFNDGHLLYTFNRPIEKPSFKILDPQDFDSRKITEFNKAGDSVLVWVPEIKFDSLTTSISDAGVPLDTIVIKRNKRDTYNSTVQIYDNLSGQRVKTKGDILLTMSVPLSAIDQSKVQLTEDSIPVKNFRITKDTTSQRRYKLSYPWRSKRQYDLKIADNAVTSIMNGKNKSYAKSLSAYIDDNFGNLLLNVTVPDSSKQYIVQLLGNSDDVVKENLIKKSGKIQYIGLPAGKYKARIVYDLNNNGKWDTGNVIKQIQPEPIMNNDKEFSLRPSWDLEDVLTIPPVP
ncbi:hypothetical protein GS399_02295 [Pedobacter sp. HMF7647]|uniref:SbsA Ig-like domain-containing protein n=1 Tax=Hufsiella arboris TaxID=2695275 RepID=A0A7K1Y5B8_9SPHI|nr:Ig-like domain-containing protein [Hufsiella arboris]MXV49784.1 hypothetical protein [Hufsiella arboris]